MKHIIIFIQIIAIALACNNLKAQSLVYEPFIPGQTNGAASGIRSNVERIHTSAYCLLNNGEVAKLRIEVAVSGNSIAVVAYYEPAQAMVYNATGQWRRLPSQARVSKCLATYGGNPLEQEFMYKAYIRGTTYYFDL